MPPAPQTPDAKSPPNQSLKQIRTFQGDIAQALESQHESLYSIQAKERARAQQIPGTKTEKSILFFLGGLLLIVLTGVAGWYTYTEFLTKTAPPPVIIPASRFISVEQSVDVNAAGLSRDALFQAMTDVPLGGRADQVQHLVLRTGTSTLLSTEAFFAAINASAPSSLVRAFDQNFMLGSYGDDYFLIFKLTSYPNAFAGMLQWEPTMAADLQPLFSATIPATQNGPANVFKDTVSKNKDVRELTDASGTPMLVYSFFGQDYVVVTDSIDTLQTLLGRLTQKQLVQ